MEPLLTFARSIGLPLHPEQIDQFRRFTSLLLERNRHVNLTALRDETALLKHFHIDALALLPVIAKAEYCSVSVLLSYPWRAADVGSGGGAPAIPLAIAWPRLHYTLIESIAKKARFLEEAKTALGLNIDVLNARAEDVGRQPATRQAFDLVTARAVAALPTLVELTLPLLRVGGLAVYPKGPKASEEASAARMAIERLGGRLENLTPITLPEHEAERWAVVVRKVRPTPEAYPRRAGVPAKRPLLA